MPLISIIIPVYNGEKTIQETIQSVLKQTFSNFELIIVNDGSTDSTLDIIFSIQDPRLKVFSDPNAGQAQSRNRGVAQAIGEYIAFMDADDLWTPDKLEAQLQALQANPQAAVAYSWTDYIDESGQFLQSGQHITVTGNVYEKLLVTCFLESGSNPLIRTQALTEVGGFHKSLSPAEDWDLYLRLAVHYQFICVPTPQILYRISASSASAHVRNMESAGLQVIDRAFAQAPESLQHLKKKSLANFYTYLCFKLVRSNPKRQNILTDAQLFWRCFRHAPFVMQRLGKRLILILFLRFVAGILLPTQQTQALLTAINKVGK